MAMAKIIGIIGPWLPARLARGFQKPDAKTQNRSAGISISTRDTSMANAETSSARSMPSLTQTALSPSALEVITAVYIAIMPMVLAIAGTRSSSSKLKSRPGRFSALRRGFMI